MQAMSKRLSALEQKLAPPRPIVTFIEDRAGQTGLFRRIGDCSGRLLHRSQLAADAGPDATRIVVIYDKKPVEGIDTPAVVIQLPNNGRGDNDGETYEPEEGLL